MITPATAKEVVSTLEEVLYHLSVEADEQEYRAADLIASVKKTLDAFRCELSGGVAL